MPVDQLGRNRQKSIDLIGQQRQYFVRYQIERGNTPQEIHQNKLQER